MLDDTPDPRFVMLLAEVRLLYVAEDIAAAGVSFRDACAAFERLSSVLRPLSDVVSDELQ